MESKSVPEGVGGDFFGDPGGFFGVLKNGLNGTFAHLGATAPVLEEKLFGPVNLPVFAQELEQRWRQRHLSVFGPSAVAHGNGVAIGIYVCDPKSDQFGDPQTSTIQ